MVKASDDPAIARQAIAAVVNRDVDAMVGLTATNMETSEELACTAKRAQKAVFGTVC